MAARQKRARSAKATTRTRPNTQPKNPIAREAVGLLTATSGVLLLVSVFFENAGGFIGGGVRGFLIGLLGFGAYIVPFALVAFAVHRLT